MESDDEVEIEVGLPKIPKGQYKAAELNLGIIRNEQHQEFEFELPEVVETEEHEERRQQREKALHPANVAQMELRFVNKLNNLAALKVMFGDFSDIEQLMHDVDDTAGGIKKKIVRPGTGKTVKKDDMVRVHYLMGAELMDDLIDSTYPSRSPKRFRVGAEEMLPVMDIGVSTMRVGEIAKFLATSHYAFGQLGAPLGDTALIPKDARVMMQIEVLEAEAVPEKDCTIAHMSWRERQGLPFEQLYKYAIETKKDGNREFRTGHYERAKTLYLGSLDCVKDIRPMTEDEKYDYYKLRQQVCNNLAHTYFKLEKFKRALKYAEAGAEVPVPGMLQAKSHYWCAKALFELGQFETCFSHIEKADSFHHDYEIKHLKDMVEKKLELEAEKEKELCTRMMNAKMPNDKK